jgi:catechol 2,3-dioxygenase-like lactoylglutathione lyase family enzyme
MAVTNVFAGIAVADIEAARAWYTRLAGRDPDLIPNAIEAAWQMTDTGWIYIVVDAERCGRSQLTLLVDDLEERAAAIAGRGIEVGPIDVIPGAVKTCVITDPDGNRLQIGQPLGDGA